MIPMKKVRNFRVLRPVARVLAGVCLLLWQAPPAQAFRRPQLPKGWKTQTPNAELKEKIAARERREREAAANVDSRPLTEAELSGMRGRGVYRNPYFSGTLPWQRSFRDVNLCNGNLFKSFTDIQVQPARGAGLAFQRTYNSNDGRVGPFGIGWTHAYDIRMEESADVDAATGFTNTDPDAANDVPRTDFFGGKHTYHRDADGLYSPPPYLYDELSSEYENTLVSGPPVANTDSEKGRDGTVKHFTRIGNARVCDSITDRHGNQTTLTYNTVTVGGVAMAQLSRVTDPSGRYLDITWTNLNTSMSPAWRITQVRGPYDSATTSYVYTVTYEYNGDFNLWKVHQDPSGLNRITTFTYTTYTDGTNTETGLLASISDPLSHTVSYTYGLQSTQPVATPTGTLWVIEVDEPGSGATAPWTLAFGGTFTGMTYGASGEVPVGNGFEVGMYGYNASTLNLEQAVGLIVDSRLRDYITLSGPLYRLDATYYHVYDDDNNVVIADTVGAGASTFNANHQVAHATYGPHGNVLTQYLEGASSAVTTTTYYDASKYFQKASVTDPNSHTTSFDYYDDQDTSVGNRGEVKWVRDARYGVTGKQFSYTYNLYGQKTSETNLNDVETDYTYGDTWGNLTQTVQDPGTGHLNRTTTISYDVAGRVVSSTDPKSQTSSFTYNGVGQPYQATLPSETVTYTYGSNGRTASVQDGRGTTTIAYESGNDRVSSVTDPVTGAISYTYTLFGQRASVTLPGSGTWTYTYDIADRDNVLPKDDLNSIAACPLTIADDQGRKVEYTYDNVGGLLTAKTNQSFDGSGNLLSYVETDYAKELLTQATGYSPVTRGNLAQIQNTWHARASAMSSWTSSVLVQNDYTYNGAGQRLTNQLSDNSGPIRTESYGYDALNRLTSVDYGDGETQGYAFDPMGNRTSKSDTTTGTVTEAYTYNNANMLLTRGSNSYTNDSNGNTLTGGGRTNTWDGENRLTQCVYGGVTTTHTYDMSGLRHRTVNGSSTNDFVIDGDAVVRTFLNSNVDTTYFQGARGPEYERIGSASPIWYLYDGLGSVLGTVNSSGTIVNTRKYDVYGAVRGSSGGSGPKHKFVGSLGHPSDDETGLIYMRARYYDSITGRFQSEDPAGDGANWFAYVNNNPIASVDSSGKFIDILVEGLIDDAQKLGEQATADAAKEWGKDKIMSAVAEHTGELMGYLAASELEADWGYTNVGFFIKNSKTGRQIVVDFVDKYDHGGPHIDFQPEVVGGVKYLRKFLQGFGKGLAGRP